MWTVKLDDQERCESFPTWRLHALEEPEPEQALQPFQPQLLEAELPVHNIQPWIAGYCGNPDAPVSLRLRRPDGRLWFEFLTQQRSLEEASDSELLSLRYICSGQAARGAGRYSFN